MKLNARLFALFLGVFSLAHAVDTLDVFVLRVQFKEESPNNSLTTGTGLFDSDTATYNLDPSGGRGKVQGDLPEDGASVLPAVRQEEYEELLLRDPPVLRSRHTAIRSESGRSHAPDL